MFYEPDKREPRLCRTIRSRRSSRRARSAGSPRSAPRATSISRPTRTSTASTAGRTGDVRQRRPQGFVSFIEETKEFVCNLATWDLREQMNATSAPLPRGVNEMVRAGLAPAPSRLVKPPRVAAAPCALECKLLQIVAARRPRRPAARLPRGVRPGGRRPYRRAIHRQTACSTPPRCSRSPAAAMTNTPWSRACSRCAGRPPEPRPLPRRLTIT